jgi:hypothetical protein
MGRNKENNNLSKAGKKVGRADCGRKSLPRQRKANGYGKA